MTFARYAYLNSSMVGPYYRMMCELGYPQLDIIKYDDGEWSIIEYHNAPLMPSHTQWKHIGVGFKNVEISEGFVKRWIEQHDPQLGHIQRREEAKTAQGIAEWEAFDRHREDVTNRMTESIVRNPDLCERIVNNGVGEASLSKLARHLRPAQVREIMRN